MKTCMRVVCISVTVLCTIMFARPATGQDLGSGYFPDTGSIQPFMANAPGIWPGRVWVQANLADSGLGYNGTYFTLGWKTHWFQDFLDGRWLVEARGHLSAESGGYFGNLGLERVFSLHAAGAEITCGIWGDYDADLQGDFAHEFTQLSVNASIETRHWMLNGNGYFPVGTVDYTTGESCFLNNVLVLQHGLDSAMQGFDGLLQLKPESLQHVNATIGIGGYGYESELVDFFGGIRGRAAMQTSRGLIITGEINHDNRFNLTGVIQLGFLFGAGAKGTEYGLLGNDLEPTIRNDHIVRVQRDLVLAIDPDTGRPYDVYHVDNLAAAGGDGSFERPFDELKDAEASAPDAIIFVREGGGTTRNMDRGINLKNGQLLLGGGVRHLIPLAGGTNFVLCNDIDGDRPRITNNAFGNAVNLANRNTVRGFIIDGTDGGMFNGISGDGTTRGSTIRNGIIEDVTITGSPILNGIFLRDIGGDWTFARNDIQTASIDGLAIFDACDSTSTFVFDSNVVSNNGRDGIHIEDYLATDLIFRNNTTDSNGRDGIRIEGFKGDALLGPGVDMDFINPMASNNTRNGISLEDAAGNFRFVNSQISGNLNHGISLIDVTNPAATDMVLITTSGPGTSVFDGNGVGTGSGVFNSLGVTTGVERLVITDTAFQNGGTGVTSESTATAAVLETSLIDNLGIINHTDDAIQLGASGGSTHLATVANTGAPLTINGTGGNGINLLANGTGPISLLEVDIDNVAMTAIGNNGIQASVIENGQMVVRGTNSTMNGVASDGIQMNINNTASTAVNRFLFDGLDIQNVGFDGADLDVGTDTFVDFFLNNSTLDNSVGGTVTAGDHGVEIVAIGDDALAPIDTRVRIQMIGNTITGFDSGDGIGIATFGDAHVLADLQANTITGNGFNQVVVGAPTIPFGDGIDLSAFGDSEIFANVLNNNITGNAEQGLDLNTFGTAEITTLVAGNSIAGNDVADDPATVPIESNNADMTATNGVTGEICLAMSNNFFNLPAVLINNSGPGFFRVELDGLTNGIGFPTFVGGQAAFTVAGFPSTVCVPAIAAEATAFSVAGFPPLP